MARVESVCLGIQGMKLNPAYDPVLVSDELGLGVPWGSAYRWEAEYDGNRCLV